MSMLPTPFLETEKDEEKGNTGVHETSMQGWPMMIFNGYTELQCNVVELADYSGEAAQAFTQRRDH